VLATTDAALDDLAQHEKFAGANCSTRLIPTFRPDAVIDPLSANFAGNLEKLGAQTGENTALYPSYLAALAARRAMFKSAGATATDHGVTELRTEWLDPAHMQSLLDKAYAGSLSEDDAHRFSNHMLIEMARMSVDDGLVMQIHAGCARSTNAEIYHRFGPDMGGDIPMQMSWVHGLTPLLNQVGNSKSFGLIAFTLDESTYRHGGFMTAPPVSRVISTALWKVLATTISRASMTIRARCCRSPPDTICGAVQLRAIWRLRSLRAGSQ